MPGLTKNKLTLLKFFYEHPEGSFYLQQIGRMIGKKPGVFQRAINHLEKEGFLTSEFKANARFFQANTKSPQYHEWRSFVLKYETLMKEGLKICTGVVLCSFMLLAGASAQEPDTPILKVSVDDAVRMAFTNNKDIQIQEKEVESGQAGIVGARSVLLPQVNAQGGYTHHGSELNTGALLSSKKDTGVYMGYADDNIWAVTLDQSVYSGGANIAKLRQAQLMLKEDEETLRALKLDTQFEVKRLFYGLMLAYETERITRQLLDQAVAHYADAQKKYKEGTASRFDVLQSKVQVTKIMPELIRAKNAIRLTLAELNKVLGRDVHSSLQIRGSLMYEHLEIREEKFLAGAYLHKPEMILRLLGIDISKWGIQAARAGYRPQVDISGEYYYRSNAYSDMFNKSHNNWDIGLNVRIPIFDGFSSRAKVLEAKARYAQSILSKENAVDSIALAIRQDCLDLRQSQAIIESQRDSVDEAREALRISIVSFDNGVGTNLDVLDSETSLAEIEQTLAGATYDYMMAKAALERDTGLLTDEGGSL